MKRKGNVGHLVSIENISTGKRELIFLYITGDEPAGAYKIVIKGIRDIRIPKRLKSFTSIKADAVTDFSAINQDYPDTTDSNIHELPVIAFYDKQDKAFKEGLFLSGLRNVIEKDGAFFPSNRVPAVVTGSDFFDREEMIDKLWKLIRASKNSVLSGPRRYGKTSIMRALRDEASEKGFRPVMIDLESIFTPEEFISRIWVEIEWSDMAETEKLKKFDELKEEYRDRWFEQGAKVFREITNREEKILFLFDECPYMLDNFLGIYRVDKEEIDDKDKEKTNRFIKWFREQRDLCVNKAVFCITGSVSLNPYLKDNDLANEGFSDCKEVRLTFFDSKTVRIYVESLLLGQGIVLCGEVLDEIVRLTTPGIPYFIQIVMNHVSALYRDNPSFSIKSLQEMYQEKITGMEGRRLFDTFDRHFYRYGRREPGARAILKELSITGEKGLEKQELKKIYTLASGAAKSREFDTILGYLEYDFYIEKIQSTNQYRFASPILRDYWKKNQHG